MITYGGERVTLDTGAPSIHTIGVALGRIPRFCGHTQFCYPVLFHCIVVARLLPGEIAIHGLLHDAQESLFADVPTPMKSQIARNRERKVLERIYESVGIPFPDDEVQELVHDADHVALIAEAHVLGHPGAESQWGAVYDKKAARLTREWMGCYTLALDAKWAGFTYENTFELLVKRAGLKETVRAALAA